MAALVAFMVALLGYVTVSLRGAVNRKLDELGKAQAVIKHEVTNNHGTSTKDAVDRTEAATFVQLDMLHSIQRDIGGIREEIHQLHVDDSELRKNKEHDHNEIFTRLYKLERGQNGRH